MHLGEEDEFIIKEARRAIIAALKDKPNVEIHTYPGCSHAFARHGGTHYDAAAAHQAAARALSFFRSNLGVSGSVSQSTLPRGGREPRPTDSTPFSHEWEPKR